MWVFEKMRRMLDWFFTDPVRPVEIISGLNLLALAVLFYEYPALVDRPPYNGFQLLGVWLGIVLLLAVGVGQVASFFPLGSVKHRIATMSAASGIWIMIAVNCTTAQIQTTADANYIILAALCVLSGVYLGWKRP